MENIIDIITGFASVASVFAAFLIGRRQMYVDLIAKKRLESVNERREILKALYFYTNPEYLAGIDEPMQYIEKIIELQSALEYRFMEQLHPEQEIIKDIKAMIELLLDMVKQSYKKGDREWFTRYDKYQDYREKRDRCLRALKTYNFASWKFVQKQSMGRRADSIKSFNKSYKRTVQELEGEYVRWGNRLWKCMKKYFKI